MKKKKKDEFFFGNVLKCVLYLTQLKQLKHTVFHHPLQLIQRTISQFVF